MTDKTQKPVEEILKDLDTYVARYGGRKPDWFDASSMVWLTVAEDVAYLVHILKEAMKLQQTTYEAKIAELEKAHERLVDSSYNRGETDKVHSFLKEKIDTLTQENEMLKLAKDPEGNALAKEAAKVLIKNSKLTAILKDAEASISASNAFIKILGRNNPSAAIDERIQTNDDALLKIREVLA